MKTLIKIMIIQIFFSIISYSQDFIFFDDSPTAVSYDPSWGFVTSPSVLEKVGDKFPVSDTIKFSGTNSLKLSWFSASGGNWGIAVAAPGWPGRNVTTKDTLSFYVYSKKNIPSVSLPKIYLEDLNNKKTEKQNISEFTNDVLANTWIKIGIPIKVFENSPGSANLTKIKTVFFGQSIADSNDHTLFIDEIRMVNKNESDSAAPAIPQLLFAKGFYKHIDIKWKPNSEGDLQGYRIYKFIDGNPELIGSVDKDEMFYTDFIGKSNVASSYGITAYDISGNESELSNTVSSSTREMNDDELLTMLQECTFRYFWDYAHPTSGLIRERTGSEDVVTSGGTGMGILAIIVGIERGFITRVEGAERILKMLKFLQNADRFHGAWSHWLNGITGKVIPFSKYDDGGDLVETSYLMEGLLAVRKYFSVDNLIENQIRSISTQLWEEVEWDWYRNSEESKVLFWHWSPNYNWQMNMPVKGYNEAMITYLLAIASPTHSVPAELYNTGWITSNYVNGKTFYDLKLDVGYDYGGPLFFVHYSFLGFDPRNKRDAYTNYFKYARNVALVHKLYAIDNPKNHVGYDENTWGLTASDDPLVGYTAHSPMFNDNGTITPTAALSSFPYTPNESMAAFKNFYNKYGKKLWGSYGFKDAFNPELNWTAGSYLAIDQAPIIIMIENYRTGLIWNLFMSNSEIKPMMDSIGFYEDIVNVKDEETIPLRFDLKNNYPNPFNPTTTIKYYIFPIKMIHESSLQGKLVQLKIYDILGKEIATLVNKEQKPGEYEIEFNAEGLTSGVYYYRLQADSFVETKKMLLLR